MIASQFLLMKILINYVCGIRRHALITPNFGSVEGYGAPSTDARDGTPYCQQIVLPNGTGPSGKPY
jgi:hypothetical protein